MSPKYPMDHLDFINDNGLISIFKLLTRPRYTLGDPRYLSPEICDRLARRSIEQMENAVRTQPAIDVPAG